MNMLARALTVAKRSARGTLRRVLLAAGLVPLGPGPVVRLERWSGEVGSTILHVEPLPRMAGIHLELRRAPKGSYFFVHVPPESRHEKPTEYMTPDEIVEAFVKEELHQVQVDHPKIKWYGDIQKKPYGKVFELTLKYGRVVISIPWHLGIWRIEEYRLRKELGTASGVNVEALPPVFTLGHPGGL